MKEEVEAGISTMILKATGRQRFKIKDVRRQVDGYVYRVFKYFILRIKYLHRMSLCRLRKNSIHV
jgi:Lon protease-like protein